MLFNVYAVNQSQCSNSGARFTKDLKMILGSSYDHLKIMTKL